MHVVIVCYFLRFAGTEYHLLIIDNTPLWAPCSNTDSSEFINVIPVVIEVRRKSRSRFVLC